MRPYCVFCNIVAGSEPANIIYQDDDVIVVQNILRWVPVMLLAMVITLLLKPGLMTVCIAIMIVGWPDVARLIRGQALRLKHKDYVKASRALGASDVWIILRQLLPGCLSMIIVSFSMGVPGAIMYEAGMSFFGYGIQAPTPDWGLMVSENRSGLSIQPLAVVAPIIFIVLYTVGGNLIAEGAARVIGRTEGKVR